MKELLTKKYAGLPGWAWLAIGVAGVGAGILLIRYQQSKNAASTPAALTATTSPDLTTGNASGNETNSETGSVGGNGIINNPFPETNVNGQAIPIIPPGYQAVYDENGNIIGFEPIPANPTPQQPVCKPGFHFQPTAAGALPPVGSYPVSGGVCVPDIIQPPTKQGGQTFTLTKTWLAAHKHGPLHQLADMFGITYQQLFDANKSILGNDPNHAKYKAGDVLTIPAATSSTNVNALTATRRRAAA